ncbi:hypothetical protein ACFT0E_38255, partial [Streptomyces sp. NPDC057052]
REAEPEPEPGSAPAAAHGSPRAGTGVFAARVGGEEEPPDGGPARPREVRSAWQGLLELRRMTNPDGAVDRPCGWERTHLVPAAALALEAAGHRPAGPDTAGPGADRPGADRPGADRPDAGGYRVRATPQPDAVAVRGPDDGTLRDCAATLEKAGWQTSEHTDPRNRTRYLLASPRRV